MQFKSKSNGNAYQDIKTQLTLQLIVQKVFLGNLPNMQLHLLLKVFLNMLNSLNALLVKFAISSAFCATIAANKYFLIYKIFSASA